MKTISIIGAGRVGTSLGNALSKAGYTITHLSCRSLQSAQESFRIIGQGKPSVNNLETARSGKIIFLSVPDDEIEKVAQELASSDLQWPGKSVFHCSGLLPAQILKPLKDRGTLTASIHPIQTFSKKNSDVTIFQDSYIGIEGDNDALRTAHKITHDLGGRPLLIRAEDKPLYHAAFSMASNFFVVLLDTAVSLLKSSGLDEGLATQILLPLVQGTLQNIHQGRIRSALTGPVIRGDEKTVKAHLDILVNIPAVKEIYRKLGTQALVIAKEEKGLNSQKIKELNRLLEGK